MSSVEWNLRPGEPPRLRGGETDAHETSDDIEMLLAGLDVESLAELKRLVDFARDVLAEAPA